MHLVLSGKMFPADNFNGVIDCIWTSHEHMGDYHKVFRSRERLPNRPEPTQAEIDFETLLSLSRTCSSIRTLCLPRLFGTIHFTRIKSIGLFRKAIESNCSLGAYAHTFRIWHSTRLWPNPTIPSQAMAVLFTKRTMETLEKEVEKRKPGAFKDHKRGLEKYCLDGPDGLGEDSNIKSPEDLKRALEEIFRSLINLQALSWYTENLPITTQMIQSLEATKSLRRLCVIFGACEEDYFQSSLLPVGQLHPPNPKLRTSDFSLRCITTCKSAPIWLLSPHLTHLQVFGFARGSTCFEGILQEGEAEERMDLFQRQGSALIKTLGLAGDLQDLDLQSFNYFGEDESRPEVLLSILPTVACTPRVAYERENKLRKREKKWNRELQALCPALQLLFERKGSLNSQDIRDFGREVETEVDHRLNGFAGFLQEEGLSEEIAKKWNERYG